MVGKPNLSRREFMKLSGLTALAFSPLGNLARSIQPTLLWPTYTLDQLPQRLQVILRRTPRLVLDEAGTMRLLDTQGNPSAALPLAQTQWNIEHSNSWDRLDDDVGWGIVLHWYGDDATFDRSVTGYLRGFNGIRRVGDYETRTSAHFLVGPAQPTANSQAQTIGVIQTQAADTDGHPFSASHLQPLDYEGHQQRQQYFVRALYQLGYQEPTIYSILQDFYDGARRDPNMRTLAVEITGYDFETRQPSDQQLANVLGVIWALMRRYNIPASSLLGHNEIQVNKPDPGKKFMALMRCLLAAKALVEEDAVMRELVFGQYLGNSQDTALAIRVYLRFLRDYLVLVARPAQVYPWEAASRYWFLHDLVSGSALPQALTFQHPLPGASPSPVSTFTQPANHEGVDLYLDGTSQPSTRNALLFADGVCLFAGEARGSHPGRMAIFRHRQPDGSEVLSIYGRLETLAGLQPGAIHPAGSPIGTLAGGPAYPFILHFAIAYGATWETDLRNNIDAPYRASPAWIRERYLEPLGYLDTRLAQQESTPNQP